MPQFFPRQANVLAKTSLALAPLLPVLVLAGIYLFNDSSYMDREEEVREQPVPFSHKHHVAGLGLDCRYCHTSVEESAFAGIPPTHTCMTCHSQIWTEADLLEPVRESYAQNKPIEWTRVHDLPDFVYFNHSIHVNKGVGCESCHGRVDQMPLMYMENALHMSFCLNCHRDPEPNLRPKEEITTMGWEPELAHSEDHSSAGHGEGHTGAPQDAHHEAMSRDQYQAVLYKEYNIAPRKNLEQCYACHR